MKVPSKDIFEQWVNEILFIYSENEAKAVIYRLWEDAFGITKTQILINSPIDKRKLNNDFLKRLKTGEPVQYIVGFEYFNNSKFKVNPNTLIPRVETEELVLILIDKFKQEKQSLKILDIGTGSGCIAISMAQNLPNAIVEAWDISLPALETAKENAKNLSVKVLFSWVDVLGYFDAPIAEYNLIISNPPYVLESDKALMLTNVLEFEPAEALFVPNENPLLFYKIITKLATKKLLPQGTLAFEIHENFGEEVNCLLKENGFKEVEVLKDIHGKDRFVIGVFSKIIN